MRVNCKLPDLARSAKILKISVQLENVNPETFLGMSILNGLREKRLTEVIKMIKEQAKHDRNEVADIVGENLLRDIESL